MAHRQIIRVSALIQRSDHARHAVVAALRRKRAGLTRLLRPHLSAKGRHLPAAGGLPAPRCRSAGEPMPDQLVHFPEPDVCRHASLPLVSSLARKCTIWTQVKERHPGWALGGARVELHANSGPRCRAQHYAQSITLDQPDGRLTPLLEQRSGRCDVFGPCTRARRRNASAQSRPRSGRPARSCCGRCVRTTRMRLGLAVVSTRQSML